MQEMALQKLDLIAERRAYPSSIGCVARVGDRSTAKPVASETLKEFQL